VTWAAGKRSEEEQEDLYMLAGIDMANHSSHAGVRNATLNLAPGGDQRSGTFILTAGVSRCCETMRSADMSIQPAGITVLLLLRRTHSREPSARISSGQPVMLTAWRF